MTDQLRCPVCQLSLPSIPVMVQVGQYVCSLQCAADWEQVAYYEPAGGVDYDPERDNRHGESATWDEERMR